MISTLYGIRAGIRSNIVAALGAVNMTGYLMTPAVPPCFEIDFPADGLVYDQSFKTGGELDIIVRGIVHSEPDEAQAQLDTWLTGSTGSVKSAIESDRTLGGAVADLRVTQATGHRRLLTEEGLFLCAEWTVHLILL